MQSNAIYPGDLEVGNTGVTGVAGVGPVLSGLMVRFSAPAETPSPTPPQSAEAMVIVEPPPVGVANVPTGLPADAVIVVADANGYTGAAMKGPPYMWCWIGGETWFYITDHPIPAWFAM
jgi:hypothetical protein